MAVKLAEEFFKTLLEEAQKDEKVTGDEETVLLRAILITNDKKRVAWTLKVLGGRLDSVSETIEDLTTGTRDVLEPIPTVQTDERTVNELLAKSISPIRAFMRGSIKLTGDKEAWRILAEPARRAAKRVTPFVDEQLPWPTFAQIEFIQRGTDKWIPNVPKCQLCGTAFGLVFSRPHHCRVCGRCVCSDCSPHMLAGNRACESCYLQFAVDSKSSTAVSSVTRNSSSSEKKRPALQATSTHSHEKGKGPTILSRALDAIMKNETSSPIECAQAESQTERLLRTTAINSLKETRTLRKELEELKSGRVNIRRIVTQALVLGVFILCWRASATSTLAWYVLVGFSSPYWKHSLVALALSQQIAPLENFKTVASTSPYFLGFALTIGLGQAVLHRMFSRLFKIYSASFTIIGIYQSVRVICERFLKLSEKGKSSVFDQVDVFVAPIACDTVLDLKSVFVKFGQYLGARSDVVPPTWSSVLAKLQDDMPFDSISHVSTLLEQESFSLEEDFDEFDMNPVASASIAQVHRAKYKGETVAVKIQHENVGEMMEGDMKAFKRIMNFIVWLNPRFEIAAQLLNAWEVEMLKELDFRTESSNLLRVKAACSPLSDVIVPDLIKATKRVLIMKWVDGFKITDQPLLDLYGVDRETLLERCVQSYSRQIFLDGFFQADPHAGNMMLQPPSPSSEGNSNSGKLVLLDFGMCVTLPDKVRLGYCRLLVALSHLSVSEVAHAITLAGYENSQSGQTPERDLEFFLFLLRDTGTREDARKESKEFSKMRKQQRAGDEAKLKAQALEAEEKAATPTEGRYFKQMPDSLVFLMRVLGLLRGLCTTLGTPTSYLENMVDYAKTALILDSLKRLDEAEEEKRHMKKIKRQTQTELERKIAKVVLDESDKLEGGYQISVIVDGVPQVDLCGGTLSDSDAKQVLPETLFPLCDLSKALCSLAALYAINDGRVETDQPILGPNATGATLKDALAHSATGMQDAVSPSSFGHQLRAIPYEKLILQVAKEASITFQKTNKSEFHTQSYGYEVDLALMNSRADTNLVKQVKERVVDATLAKEILFGGVPSDSSLGEDDFAKISHGYSEAIRLAMATAQSTKSPSSGGPKNLPSLSSLGPLPGRVVPDAAMVNDISTRQTNMPSFGAYGTARGLGMAVTKAMKTIPSSFWRDAVAEVLGTEENPVLGRIDWGLGFAVACSRNVSGRPVVLAHHSFGGNFLLFVPEKKIVAVVLVSHLTIERELTKNVLNVVTEYFGLPALPMV